MIRFLFLLSFVIHGLFSTAFAINDSTIFSENFDSSATVIACFGDTLNYKLRPDTFGLCAEFRNTDSVKSMKVQSAALSVDSLKGWRIMLSAWTKAESLTTSPNAWNGVKVMLVIRKEDGTIDYPQITWPSLSSWNWKKAWSPIAIPENAVSMSLVLGLEIVAGKVRMDSLRIIKVTRAIIPPRDSTLPIPSASPVRLRGAMIGTNADSAAIARFGSVWKGNLLRWQLGGTSYTNALSRPDYDSLLRQEMAKLDRALPICRRHGIKVLVDLHSLSTGLFAGDAAQTLLMDVWRRLASHYHDSSTVWGYNLANEPRDDSWRPGLLFLDELSDTLCRIIRAIDPAKPIIIEPALNLPWFQNFRPIGWDRGYDIQNLVYSVHCYAPFTLTHQGISSSATITYPPYGAVYPGTIDGTYWDSVQLRKSVQRAVDFQKKYRVPIYIGEFSCIRWAADHSAIRWLTDLIRIMESYGWDWTYHAYQEYHGWSVEYGDSLGDMRTPLDTDRKALLLSYFALNENPYATTETTHLQTESASNPILQIFLNPCNPATAINIDAVPGQMVSVDCFDLHGRKIITLFNGAALESKISLSWKGESSGLSVVGSGVYFVRLQTGGRSLISKLLLVR